MYRRAPAPVPAKTTISLHPEIPRLPDDGKFELSIPAATSHMVSTIPANECKRQNQTDSYFIYILIYLIICWIIIVILSFNNLN